MWKIIYLARSKAYHSLKQPLPVPHWNKGKKEYETVFPKGSHIGFSFGRKSNKQVAAVNSANNYWFAQPWHSALTTPNNNYPNYEIFYSTPELNGEGLDKANAVIRSCPSYDYIIVGMDACYWTDPNINK